MVMPDAYTLQDADALDDLLYDAGAGGSRIIIPPDGEDDVSELERVTAELLRNKLRLIDEHGDEITLEGGLQEAFSAVATILNSGNAVSIRPERRMLSTSEAAKLLGISRQTMVRLLDKGEIPYTRPSNHRRVALDDIVLYQKERRRCRLGSIAALHEIQESFADVAGDIGVRSEHDVQALVAEVRRERR